MLSLLLLLACGTDEDGNVCTEMGCIDGLQVGFDPPLTAKGTYTFDVTVDGVAYACEAAIPLAGSTTVCGDGGVVSIQLSGTQLPVSEQTIPGLVVASTPKSVHIVVTRDGDVVAKADLSPTYITVRPNGPDCDPTCDSASVVVATK